MFFDFKGILQHFKFENWRIRYLMSRTGQNCIVYLKKIVFRSFFLVQFKTKLGILLLFYATRQVDIAKPIEKIIVLNLTKKKKDLKTEFL